MSGTLMVAAGGGGDVLGAALIQRALADLDGRQPVHYASWSWDRLAVDPVPGPRDPTAFCGLRSVGRLNFAVQPISEARPPFGSLLPRIAGFLNRDVFLLDPRRGAVGLGDQLRELITELKLERILVCDISGDILAEGHEVTLSSPLADFLVLAAVADVPVKAEVVAGGLGLDGEVPAARLREHLAALGKDTPALRLTVAEGDSFGRVFEWHPSEATGLLWLAAKGARGVAEIRGDGLLVELDELTPAVYWLGLTDVLERNRHAGRLRETRSLNEAEARLIQAKLPSELELERRKAEQLSPDRDARSVDMGQALTALRSYEDEAARRGISFLTMRRVGEVLGLSNQGLRQLRAELRAVGHPQYKPPVWLVRAARDSMRTWAT